MGSLKKRLKRAQQSDIESGSEDDAGFDTEVASEQEYDVSDDYSDGEEVDEEEGVSEGEDYEEDSGDDDEEGEEEDDEESGDDEEDDKEADAIDDEDDDMRNGGPNFDEIEELEKEYKQLQDREKSLIQNLKKHKDEDIIKGQAIRSQKVLWDKALELRIQMQKVFSNSNRLPPEPIRSFFCESDKGVSEAYSDVISSAKETLDSLLHLQEALFENNPSIAEAKGDGESQSSLISSGDFGKTDVDKDNDWSRIFQMQSSVAPFRNKAIDKWQRKADVNSGAVAKKAKLLAFNQNISDQVATYMRDPSKMVRSMQMKREQVGVFGSVVQQDRNNDEGNADGDPELLADSEFYQQLLKEFLETVDNAAGLAYVLPGKSQSKKRKVVDRRASKSRKIRYHVHEKIVNFMAPQPMDLPPMAPMLFDNLFGLKTPKSTLAS